MSDFTQGILIGLFIGANVGLFIGANVGLFIMALLIAARGNE